MHVRLVLAVKSEVAYLFFDAHFFRFPSLQPLAFATPTKLPSAMSNLLSEFDATRWIGDGADGSTLSVESAAAEISLSAAKLGTPLNARLDVPALDPSAGSLYYEVLVGEGTEGSLGVGFVTESGFQPGWGTKGCFYNGNITNGSAGLTFGFGPTPRAGDAVGAYLQRLEGGSRCRITFYHNGRCLGAAFDMASSDGETFYPCLHLEGSGRVRYSAPGSLPAVVEREPPVRGDAYSGDWFIRSMSSSARDIPLPGEPKKIVLTFAKGAGAEASHRHRHRLSARVANNIVTALSIVSKTEAFDIIEVGPCMSTKMMPPPELEPVERFVQSAFNGGLNKMAISENGELALLGPTAEIVCGRHEQKFDPVASYL